MFQAVWTIQRVTFLETARHPAYYLLTAAATLLVFLSQNFTFFGFYAETNMVRETGFATLTLWGVLAALLLSHHLLHVEIENRSALTLLAKPVSRTAYLLGKYLGLLRALATGAVFLTAVLILTLWMFDGLPKLDRAKEKASATLLHVARDTEAWGALEAPVGALGGIAPAAALATSARTPEDLVWNALRRDFVPRNVWPVLASLLLVIGHTAVVASFSLAFAAWLPPVGVATGTVGVYLVGHLTDYLAAALAHAGPAAAAAGRVLRWTLPNLEPFNPADHVARGEMLSAIYIALALAYALCYATLVLGTAAWSFSRRELP